MARKKFTNAIRPKRDEQKSAGVDIDFEDLLATAIVSVAIKRPKKRTFISRRRP
jgi:hypothetical protein